jgi:homoserine kinase
MNSMEQIKVFAPATIGNVSVGFDALGLALAPVDGSLLGDIVTLETSPVGEWSLEVGGPFASELPENAEENIVLAACRRFDSALKEHGISIAPLKARLEKCLPIGTGLGSSASSVVASLEALNRFHRHPLSSSELFGLMAEMEGGVSGGVHTDNIGPSLYGGLRLCAPGGTETYALPWPAAWRVVVCWPGTRLETRKSRAALPQQVPLDTAVRQSATFASFVHAIHIGNTKLAADCLVDFLAEPHRKALLPGFESAKAGLAELGALAVGISGSGPSLFAVVDTQGTAQAVKDWVEEHYRANERGFVHVCGADLGGARSIE